MLHTRVFTHAAHEDVYTCCTRGFLHMLHTRVFLHAVHEGVYTCLTRGCLHMLHTRVFTRPQTIITLLLDWTLLLKFVQYKEVINKVYYLNDNVLCFVISFV